MMCAMGGLGGLQLDELVEHWTVLCDESELGRRKAWSNEIAIRGWLAG
jgi:hypothetical protein